MNAPRIARVKSSHRKALNEMVSIIVMRLVPAATQAGRGVAIKGVTAKETLNGIRLWRMTLARIIHEQREDGGKLYRTVRHES